MNKGGLDFHRSSTAFFSRRRSTLPFHLKIIILRNVRDADDEDAHFATGTVDDTWRDVDEGTLADGMFDAVEHDRAAAFEDVVDLGGALVVVKLRAVDVHGMRPGGGVQIGVFTTDQSVPPAAGAALSRRVAFMTDELRAGSGHRRDYFRG
jgi:hypothetical protein